jgi:hypothetical protein
VILSKKFEKTWETDIPFILSYVYDKGLTFGAQHIIQGDQLIPLYSIPKKVKPSFDELYSTVKEHDSSKY